MSHATLDELTDAVHGFAPKPAHECADCHDLERRLVAELGVLRRADARLAPAARRHRASPLPVAYAAAVLLAITAGVIAYRGGSTLPTTQEQKGPELSEIIKKALEGDEDSLKALRTRGPGILRPLCEARLKAGETKGSGAVAGLVQEFKTGLAGDNAVLFQKMDAIKTDLNFAGAPLDSIADYVRELSGLNVVLDPEVQPPGVTLKLNNASILRVFDAISLMCGVEVDIRYGVIFISTPERLYGAAKEEKAEPLTDEQVKNARRLITALGSSDLEARDRATADLFKLGRGAIPVLETATKDADKEIAARCKSLIERLSPRPAAGTLPAAAAFRAQKLGKDDDAVRAKLDTMKVSISFEATKLGDVVDFIRDFSGVNIIVQNGVAADVTMTVNDLKLSNVFELITLPQGIDVKIENGVVIIYDAKK